MWITKLRIDLENSCLSLYLCAPERGNEEFLIKVRMEVRGAGNKKNQKRFGSSKKVSTFALPKRYGVVKKVAKFFKKVK